MGEYSLNRRVYLDSDQLFEDCTWVEGGMYTFPRNFVKSLSSHLVNTLTTTLCTPSLKVFFVLFNDIVIQSFGYPSTFIFWGIL